MNEQASFSTHNFHQICNHLARLDADLGQVIALYGYPPLFKRPTGFQTLIHIILEQQVSLASAKAAMDKLIEAIGEVSPSNIMAMSNEALKACYFSRQKIVYAKALAAACLNNSLQLDNLNHLSNEDIRNQLIQIKGIGHWTIDVYLMMSLNRSNLFPIGDIALVNGTKRIKQLPPHTTKETIATIAEQWQPYKTIAAYIVWWCYIKEKNITYPPYN